MLVRAKERLFYLWIRHPGEEFELRNPDLFSPEVMEAITPPPPEPTIEGTDESTGN